MMGLLDITTKILSVYKADIGDHKAKIKELTGEQKKLAIAEKEAAEARNKQTDDSIKGIGKVAVAVGSAAAAIAVGKAGLDEYIKYQAVVGQTSEDTFSKLKAASGGLRTEMDLLTFSAKTQHGSFKLNTDQQVLALEAMRALEKRGVETGKAFDVVTKAIVEANGEGLKEFGIQVDNGKTKAEAFKNVMKALATETAAAGGNLEGQGDDAKRLGVQWDDALSNIKRAIGEIVVALGPLIGAVADLASYAGDFIRGAKSLLPGSLGDSSLFRSLHARQDQEDRENKIEFDAVLGAFKIRTNRTASYSVHRINPTEIAQSGIAMTERFKDANEAMRQGLAEALGQDKIAEELNRILSAANGKAREAVAKAKAGARLSTLGAYRKYDAQGEFFGQGYQFDSGVGGTASGYGSAFGGGFGDPTQLDVEDLGKAFNQDRADRILGNLIGQGKYGEAGRNRALASDAAGAARQSKLEAIFGPLAEFNAYAAGFKLLEDAVNSAFSAWVDGSKSAGDAFKSVIKTGLAATAIELFGQAIRHGAWALGELVTGNPAKAAGHAASAAKFTAGAIAIGALAKTLGGGGPTAGAGASSSTGGGGAAQVGSSSPQLAASSRPITILLGDEFGSDSPRRRQQRAVQTIEQAKRAHNDSDGIIYG